MNLQEWRKLSFQLAADLQTLHLEARRHGRETVADEALALRNRVEDRRFTVAVVGDFRRGKSTFINALLGRSILPSDVAPTTATVNRVTYGSKPAAELHFHDGRPPEVVSIEALAEHVTKLSGTSTARAAEIREAVVSFPVRFCRNDVDLLDTPGLGDEATMTAVTMRQLPYVDAAILVIMADSPFSETEGAFLDRLYAEGVTELLFVVSALDRVRRPADRERLLVGIRDRIAARIRRIADARFPPGSPEHAAFLARRGEPRVFGVSALTALEGREGDGAEAAAAIESSGMPAFEEALERFLTGADEVGLRRRLEQAEALCGAFRAPAAPGPGVGAEGVEQELARLTALVNALEAVVEDCRRHSGDAYARAAVGLQELVDRFVPRARSLVASELQAFSILPYWPARYGVYVPEASARLVDVVKGAAGLLVPDIERRLEAEVAGQHAEDARLLRTVGFVLGHVEQALRGLGHRMTGPLWTPPEPVSPPAFDSVAFVEGLTPPVATFQAELGDPAIETALQQAGKKSAFDQLLSLNFGGLQGKWVALVSPRVAAACGAWWTSRAPSVVLRERLDVLARRRLLPLEPVSQALRGALGEIVACRERAAIGRDRQRHDLEHSSRTVDELAGRLREARVRLGAG